MQPHEILARHLAREALLDADAPAPTGPTIAPAVAHLGEEVTFAPGAALYRAGEPALHFYAFVRGRVQIARARSQPVVVPGWDVVGLLDLLADRPRSHDATAVTEVRAMRVDAHAYLDLLEDDFELALGTIVGLGRSLHQASLELAPGGGFPDPRPSAPAAGSLDLVRRIELLRAVAPFGRANVQALVRLVGLAREGSAGAGEQVFARGEAPRTLFFVSHGIVEASHEMARLVGRFGRGDLVGGQGVLGDPERGWEARALSSVALLSLREEDLFDVMEEHFELTRSVLAGMAREYERLLLLPRSVG